MTTKVVFWDVDTQHDFMDEDGRLPVPSAAEIVPNLARLTQFAAGHGIPTVATADAHLPGDPEFDEFGEHCVPGTAGQLRIDETRLPACEVVAPEALDDQVRRLTNGELQQLVVEKQVLDVFDAPLADRLLEALAPERIVVYGVATEYCVRAEILSMLKRGRSVTVVTDAIRPIDQEAGARAVREMEVAGARLADTASVLSSVEPDPSGPPA